MEKVEDKIKRYQKQAEELKCIRKEIERQYKEFKHFMKPQKDCLEEKKKELNKYLNDNMIKVRLKDFVSALAHITGEEINNFKYSLKTNMYCIGKYTINNKLNKDKRIKYSYDNYPMIILSIISPNKEYTFNYKMDINEIQYDGRKMIDHCSAVTTPNVNYLVGFKTDIVIDKDIDDIMVSFDLRFLSHMVDSDLLIETLNECNNQKVKKLGGKK